MVFGSCFAVPFLVAWYHAEQYGLYDFGSLYSSWWLVGYGVTFAASAFLLGIPTLVVRPVQALTGSLIAAAIPLGVASLFYIIVDPPVRSRLVVVGTPISMFAIFLAVSLFHTAVLRRSSSSDRVVVVADLVDQLALDNDMARPPERRFTLVERIEPAALSSGEHALDEIAARGRANLIVLSEAAQSSNLIVEQAARLHEEGMRIRGLAAFGDEWLGKFPINELARTSLWFDIRDLHEGQYNRLKRIMDLTIAVLASPVFVVAVPVVLVGNLFGNRGPMFFKQNRVGQRNSVFGMWKFRTMTIDANEDGVGVWTAQDDPRITPFGRFLRRSHLDELPQVMNVLRGDVSIVGPRPEQPHYVDELTAAIPFYGLRHAVKPGVTGWAQVKYPYGASEEDALEKLQYELYYLRHQSLWLDLRICIRTVRSVLFGEGT